MTRNRDPAAGPIGGPPIGGVARNARPVDRSIATVRRAAQNPSHALRPDNPGPPSAPPKPSRPRLTDRPRGSYGLRSFRPDQPSEEPVRIPAVTEPSRSAPVVGPGALEPVPAQTTLLVVHDAGDAGRAALRHAIATAAQRLVIVEFWEPVDPVLALHPGRGAGFSEATGAGAALVQVARENERRRAAAERLGATAVAIAREHGQDAACEVRRAADEAARDEVLRELAASHARPQLVVAATKREWWIRLVRGPGSTARIATNPPCPCTVVPTDAG